MTIDHTFVPKLAKKARLRFDRHEQQELLLYPERGLVLNTSAAAIVKKIDGTRSIGDIANELVIEHGAAAREWERIAGDVVELVVDLSQRGLLAE